MKIRHPTGGRNDEAGRFAPTERFSRALHGAGIDHVFVPTAWGHLGLRRERWTPLLTRLTARMLPAVP